MKNLGFLLLAFLLVVEGWASLSACQLQSGLYQQRQKLVREYLEKVGKNYLKNKTKADQIKEQRKQIDRQYYKFMNCLSGEYAQDGVTVLTATCSDQKNDPIAKLICQMFYGNSDVERVLAVSLSTMEEVDAFWALDAIAHVNDKGAKGRVPIYYGPDGPVNKYLKDLYGLVVRGNPRAVEKYFYLGRYAEGEYGELMGDQVARLFAKSPNVLFDNWERAKACKRLVQFSVSEMTDQQRNKALRDLEEYHRKKCTNRDELKQLLSVKP